MEDAAQIVKIITKEEASCVEIDAFLQRMQAQESFSIPQSLLVDYLKARSREVVMEGKRHCEKKAEIARVYAEYTQYLTSVLELHDNKEIFMGPRVRSLVQKSISSQYITREDKLFLLEERKSAHDSLLFQFDMNKALVYVCVHLVGRMEILRIEKSLLELSPDAPGESAPSTEPRKSMFVQKVPSTAAHPIRISGRASHSDIQAMLAPENGPSMSIEQYGERMLKQMEKMGLSIEPVVQSASTAPEDEDLFNEESMQHDTEEERKKKEKDQLHYGDGNRLGRK
ncbi:uncharacterized protein NEMAJ01_1348 [Nematocida major]|uniref:uncharacterized protein n=1 Tax=Nematocida major TaxID=1912982 RepID=UPI002007407D|nr:uncharacterized protein NEMAJ01_1348 [Nematocida major]KAH9386452.1 hypothetical protein NEMAJ01_1348 [Nematocida major]